MARFRYEELSPSQFENLIVDICRSLIGKGVRGFSEGPDGGRDARFDGMTDGFPSERDPWTGTTIAAKSLTPRFHASNILSIPKALTTTFYLPIGDSVAIRTTNRQPHCRGMPFSYI